MVDIRSVGATDMSSCLISGGCDRFGRVPVTAYLAQIRRLHPGRLLNWHVGMIDEDDMRAIAPYADIISFDFVGDDATIREVYGLDYTVEDYLRKYEMLRRYAKVVPHLTVGLRGGQLCGEYQALHQLKTVGLDALVLLVFMPTPGTRYAHCSPPSLDQVADLLLTARVTLPDTPLYLGCMRPGGRYRRELDALAVRAGVNKIVNPAPSAIQEAKGLSLTIQWESECCVIQRS
ncbi:MAG: hypothetical protein QXP01_02745 [Candidatus Hadarchaeum sp.]